MIKKESTTMSPTKIAVFAAAVTSALALSACTQSSSNPETGDEEELRGKCSIVDGQAGKTFSATARKTLDDPFAQVVLNNSTGSCPTKADDVLALLKAKAGATDSVFVVSEMGDDAKGSTSYRFVISQPTSIPAPAGSTTPATTTKQEELFVSVLGSPDGIEQGLVEVISFSRAKGAYNYYSVEGGRWTLMGDGTQITPGTEPKFRCAGCHTSGGPVFKELQLPWNNWNSFKFRLPTPGTQAPDFKALFDRKAGAESFEGIVVTGAKLWAKSRADLVLGGKKPGENLKSLMKQVMCEVGEPNLISTKSNHTKRFDPIAPATSLNVPPSMLLNPVLNSGGEVGFGNVISMNVTKLSSISLTGSVYVSALVANGQTLASAKGDTMFGLFVPERSFADSMMTEELVKRGILDKDVATDVLMTDFTNPVFSKARCALADTVPEKADTAAALRTAWTANLKSSKLPLADGLLARLSDVTDFSKHQTAVEAFVNACEARSKSDAAGFAKDLTKLASQRRREFHAQFESIVESDALLPADKLADTAPFSFRLNATTCVLEKQ